jgi:hypothetical protein
MIVVAERHRPLPRGLRGIRRAVVVAAHLVAVRNMAGLRAVLAGWRDARRGKLGKR